MGPGGRSFGVVAGDEGGVLLEDAKRSSSGAEVEFGRGRVASNVRNMIAGGRGAAR